MRYLLLMLALLFAGCSPDYDEREEYTSYVAIDIEAGKDTVQIYEVVSAGVVLRSVGNAHAKWVEWGIWQGPSSDVVFDCTNCVTVYVDFGYPGVYTLYCTVAWEDAYGNVTLERVYLDFYVQNTVYPSPPLVGAG